MLFFKKFIKSTSSLWFFFTKKVRKNCWTYIAADVQQEINYFRKKLAKNPQREKILNEHVWSKDFRIWMIRNGYFDLFPQASTEEEIREMLQREPDVSIMASVLKSYTPSKSVFNSLDYKNEYVQKLVIAAPSIFKDVPYEKIRDNRILLRVIIDNAKSRNDYKLLNDYIKYMVEGKTPYSELVLYAVQKSINGEVISTLIPLLKQNYSTTYVWVRENWHKVAYISNIIEKAFIPQNLPSGISDIDAIRIDGCLDDEHDALAWFKITYKQCRDITFKIMFKNLDLIQKKVTEQLFTQICLELNENPSAGYSLISRLPSEVAVRVINKCPSDTFALRKALPFSDWPVAAAKKAIKILFNKSKLYYSDLLRLSDELRTYAKEFMEIEAKIKIIQTGSVNEIQELYSAKLPKEVEHLVARSAFLGFREDLPFNSPMRQECVNLALEYMVKNDIDPEAFSYYIESSALDNVRSFIRQKGTLSKEEYEVLLLSRHNILANGVKVKD